MSNVSYNFKDPIFEKNFLYRRLAKEHLLLQEIESDLIKIEVTDVRGPLKIPDTYYIHFYLKSITGINDDQSPKYGDHHIVELHLPLKYPMESPRIYMKTEIWHPNINWEGKFKGRICGNTKEYGKGYDLTQLVFRIAEILQFKNYHAENTPPFPEDSLVAKWIKEYAEPNNIVNKWKEIYSDDVDLSRHVAAELKEEKPAEIVQDSENTAHDKKFKMSFSKNLEKSSEENDEDSQENDKKIKFKKK